MVYKGHPAEVMAVAWSPDGQFIASGSREKTVHVWVAPK
jgi:WD40 repeat protein